MARKKYQLRWRDPDGRQRKKSFESAALRSAFKWKLDRGDVVASEMLFETFAVKWLAEYSAVMCGETTTLKNRGMIEQYLVPAFGSFKLSQIKKAHLLDFRARLMSVQIRGGKTLSGKSINNIAGLLSKMMVSAVEWDMIPVNPFAGMRKIPHTPKASDFWTVDEKERFLNHCRSRDPMLAEYVLVACETGMRRGELHALQRYQLDFKSRMIRVDATYSPRLKKRLGKTKNKEVGFIPMIEPVYQCLKDRQFLAGDAYVFDRSLFTDIFDRFQRRCREFGMRPIRLHDLRHTYASTRVMAGVSLYSVQRLMRHKSIQMTERYAHLAPDFLRAEAELGSAFFAPQEGGDKAQVAETLGKRVVGPEGLEIYPVNLRKSM